jgi:8-oxo-dGTP pyrophosphatase MutT (NUDIX family)
MIEKVTGFVTCNTQADTELLLIQHPNAGIQIPAGTVEENETPEDAVLREIAEETGISQVRIKAHIGDYVTQLPPKQAVISHMTTVFSRPNLASFDWATLRRGIPVRILRSENESVQITFEEWDQFPDPQYLSYQITGWIPASSLCTTIRRHFFHLVLTQEQKSQNWLQQADQHLFKVFWSNLSCLPEIIAPQYEWLDFVQNWLHYQFI